MPRPELTPYELIASDKYWSGPIVPQGILGSLPQSADTIYQAYGELRDKPEATFKAREISALVLALEGGGTGTLIPAGEPIPLPEASSRKVIKIVEDERHISSLFSPINQAARRAHRNQFTDTGIDPVDEFNETASNMLISKYVYLGGQASAILPSKRRKIARIGRRVSYLRAAEDGSGFIGLGSTFARDADTISMRMAMRVPVMNVGTIFMQGMSATYLRRIVQAEILEPRQAVLPLKRGNAPAFRKPARALLPAR